MSLFMPNHLKNGEFPMIQGKSRERTQTPGMYYTCENNLKEHILLHIRSNTLDLS